MVMYFKKAVERQPKTDVVIVALGRIGVLEMAVFDPSNLSRLVQSLGNTNYDIQMHEYNTITEDTGWETLNIGVVVGQKEKAVDEMVDEGNGTYKQLYKRGLATRTGGIWTGQRCPVIRNSTKYISILRFW